MPVDPRGKTIEIKGLRELARDFRKLEGGDGRLDLALARANREAVAEIRDVARANYSRIYPYRQSTRRPGGRRRGFTVKGITSRASARGASIVLRRRTRPWIIGQEFGSVYRFRQFRRPPVPRNPSRARFSASAGISRGRFLYPAIRSEVPRIAAKYADIVTRALLGRAP